MEFFFKKRKAPPIYNALTKSPVTACVCIQTLLHFLDALTKSLHAPMCVVVHCLSSNAIISKDVYERINCKIDINLLDKRAGPTPVAPGRNWKRQIQRHNGKDGCMQVYGSGW